MLFASPELSWFMTVLVAKTLNLSVFSLLSHGVSFNGFFLVVSLFCCLSFSSLACLTSKASAASGLVNLSVATSASSSLSLYTSPYMVYLSSASTTSGFFAPAYFFSNTDNVFSA